MPDNIKWSAVCINCKANNNGICPNAVCFEVHYDEQGNWIPQWIRDEKAIRDNIT